MQQIQHLNGYLDLLPCLYYSSRASKSTKITGLLDDTDLASRILRMIPRTWQEKYKLNGATVPQCVRKLLEAQEFIEKAFLTDKDHEGPKSSTKLSDSTKRKMIYPLMKGFPRDAARKNIVRFASNMGVHTQPTTLRTARSMNPTAHERRTSMGRMPVENLVDPRNLIKEEVAMCNYPLKLRN